MHEGNRTEIATLGEFGLIKRLTEDIKLENKESVYGVGDDAAVLSYPDKQVLVTTDLLMEGVHFDLVYTPLKHLGYKSAMVNFSDIYAMNGTPKQIRGSETGVPAASRGHRRGRYDFLRNRPCHFHYLHWGSGQGLCGLSQRRERNRPDLRIGRLGSRLHGTSVIGT